MGDEFLRHLECRGEGPRSRESGKKWFFITTDIIFGHALEAEATRAIKAEGGTVVGSARHPIGTHDFSSFLLQAQSSGADVIALAAGGTDLIAAVRQAKEFAIPASSSRSTCTSRRSRHWGSKRARGFSSRPRSTGT